MTDTVDIGGPGKDRSYFRIAARAQGIRGRRCHSQLTELKRRQPRVVGRVNDEGLAVVFKEFGSFLERQLGAALPALIGSRQLYATRRNRSRARHPRDIKILRNLVGRRIVL